MSDDDCATDWHALASEAVLHALAADGLRGLDAGQVAERLAAHGPNALPEPAPRPGRLTFVAQCRSPPSCLLLAAAVLAVALGHVGDALVILAVVSVNATIGTVRESRAARSMAALRRLATLRVRGVRDRVERVIETRDPVTLVVRRHALTPS